MNKKIFVFDMDGTILNSYNQLLPSTIEAIKHLKAKNHLAIIATGRPYHDAKLDLKPLLPYLDYLICNNGAYFVDLKTKNFVRRHTLPLSIVDKVIALGKKYNCLFALHGNFEAKRAKLGNLSDQVLSETFVEYARYQAQMKPIDEIFVWAKEQKIVQASLAHSKEVALQVKSDLAYLAKDFDIHIANEIYIDINPKGISKMSALQEISSLAQFKIVDLVVFGDSGNDLQMLKQSGLSFCMENGSEEAKAVANKVIGSNNTNAISQQILEIINQE